MPVFCQYTSKHRSKNTIFVNFSDFIIISFVDFHHKIEYSKKSFVVFCKKNSCLQIKRREEKEIVWEFRKFLIEWNNLRFSGLTSYQSMWCRQTAKSSFTKRTKTTAGRVLIEIVEKFLSKRDKHRRTKKATRKKKLKGSQSE